MKTTLSLIIMALFVLAGCAQPPADAPQAVVEEIEQPLEVAEEENEETEVVEEQEGESEELEESETTEEIVEEDVSEEKVPFIESKSTINFEGFGPGKSHKGLFADWEGFATVRNGKIAGGEVTIQAGSANTDSDGLDNHLKRNDFFDVANFPEITFVATSISNGVMEGTLTLHGVSKDISFPVEVSEDSVTATFLFDTSPFGMKHFAVNQDVRISFEVFI